MLRKLARRDGPCIERKLSGWNCTPSIGCCGCGEFVEYFLRIAMTSFSSVHAEMFHWAWSIVERLMMRLWYRVAVNGLGRFLKMDLPSW